MATQHEEEGRADRIEHEIAAHVPDGVDPQCALVAVMHAITRRMSRGEARRVVAAMPERHRAYLERVLDERDEPAERLGRPGVLAAVESELGDVPNAEKVTHAVLSAVGRALPQGLLRGALAQLPPEVASLWRTEVEGPAAGPVTSYPRPIVADGVSRDTELDHPLVRRLEEMHAVPPGFTGASTFSLVACDLARRLPRGEAQQIVDALPEPVRPLMRPCMAGREEEPAPSERDAFIERIAQQLELDRPTAELVTRAVFRVLQDALSGELVRNIESQLPEDIADMWRLGQTRLTEVRQTEKLRRVAERSAREGTERSR